MNSLSEIFLPLLGVAGVQIVAFLFWMCGATAFERMQWLITGIKRPERYYDD